MIYFVEFSIFKEKRNMKQYIFFRKEGFYSIGLLNDIEAIENAKCNIGTIRVEDINGNVIWSLKGN